MIGVKLGLDTIVAKDILNLSLIIRIFQQRLKVSKLIGLSVHLGHVSSERRIMDIGATKKLF